MKTNSEKTHPYVTFFYEGGTTPTIEKSFKTRKAAENYIVKNNQWHLLIATRREYHAKIDK